MSHLCATAASVKAIVGQTCRRRMFIVPWVAILCWLLPTTSSSSWFSAPEKVPAKETGLEFLENGLSQLGESQVAVLEAAMLSALQAFLVGSIRHLHHSLVCCTGGAERLNFTRLCTARLSSIRHKDGLKLQQETVDSLCTCSALQQGYDDHDAQVGQTEIEMTVMSIYTTASQFLKAFGARPLVQAVVVDPGSYDDIYAVYSGVAQLYISGVLVTLSVDVGPNVPDLQISGNNLAGKLWQLGGMYMHIPVTLGTIRKRLCLVNKKTYNSNTNNITIS